MESSETQQNTTTSPENPGTTHHPSSSAPQKTNENEPSPTSSNHEDHDDKQEPPATSPTKAPPNQEMERSASSYRIPSSVFARSTSETPMDWSMQSNESLFSIHTGNMSFTNDHLHWRSGDLGPPTGEAEASTSDQMFSYKSGNQSTGGGAAADDMRSREMGIAEAVMKEVIQESEGQNHPRTTMPAKNVRNTHRSHESNTSTTSFAFSVMGGETDHQKGDYSERIPSTVGSGLEQAQSQSQSLTKPVEPQPSIKSEPKTPKATEDAATCKWFSCSCC